MVRPFETLWDAESLQAEILELFGEYDPLLWDLDAGTTWEFAQATDAAARREFYRRTKGFVYQSCWNCATNDERSKYLAALRVAAENNYLTALDYGCGIGSGVVAFALAGLDRVIGADMNLPNLNFLKARLARFDLTNAKIKDLYRSENFKDDTFDLVMCTEVLEHVEDPHALGQKLADLTNPGGALVLSWSFVNMPTHLPQHFHLQAPHPDDLLTMGFGQYMKEEVGLVFDGYTWFNNMLWRKPA